jgi:hypothetical protein
MINWLKVPAGSRVWRAARTEEKVVTPRYCRDTGKTGGYFSIFHPYLSETMADEYHKDLIVSEYEISEDIFVLVGKYSHSFLPENEDLNLSHIEFGPKISAINPELTYSYHYAEVFLRDLDLNKVIFQSSYTITPTQVYMKYANIPEEDFLN